MAMSKPLAFLAVMAPKKGLKEHEIQFLAEANVTPQMSGMNSYRSSTPTQLERSTKQ
jgi:hypothetical protein